MGQQVITGVNNPQTTTTATGGGFGGGGFGGGNLGPVTGGRRQVVGGNGN